jgi:hypothetical protein
MQENPATMMHKEMEKKKIRGKMAKQSIHSFIFSAVIMENLD